MGRCVIRKEKVGTIGPKLILYTAWDGRPKKSRSNFIAESTDKKILKNYLKKANKCEVD